jgi:hypothetical protein
MEFVELQVVTAEFGNEDRRGAGMEIIQRLEKDAGVIPPGLRRAWR